MNAIRKLLHISVLLAMVCALPQLGWAVPTPTLKADQEANWDTAWETAWATAWEACGHMASAAAPAPLDDALMQSAVNISLGTNDAPSLGGGLDLVWGLSFDLGRSTAQRSSFFSFGLTAADLSPAKPSAVMQGKLFVQVQPADAEISLANAASPFAQGMQLPSGEYVVAIKKHGYATQTRRVEVVPGMAATMRVELAAARADGAQAAQAAPAAASFDAPDELAANQFALTPAMPELSRKPNSAAKAPTAPARDTQTAFAQGAVAAGLLSATGALFVDTDPADATVRVMNIKPKFKQGMQLASGVYRVEVRKDGYKTIERTVVVAAGGSSRVALAIEKAPTGRLYVETDPAGATVRVKKIRAKFSQGMELTEGAYLLDVAVNGYKPVQQEVIVAPEVDNLVRVAMERVPSGRLFVDAAPSDATIQVRNLKQTFVQGMELPAGTYTLLVSSKGHKSETKSVELAADADTRVQLALAPTQAEKKQAEKKQGGIGRLFVQSDPSATIKILKIKPKFTQGIELAPGRYTVCAVRKGFKDAKKPVDIVAGRDTFIAVNLIAKNGSAPQYVSALPDASKAPAVVSAAPTVVPAAASVVPAAQVATAQGERRQLDVEAYVSMAIVAVNAGDFQSATEACRQALKLDPNAAEAYKALGDAYLLQESYAEALSNYDKALAIAPDDTRLKQNKNYAAEQVQLKGGKGLQPTHGQATVRDLGLSYSLDGGKRP